MKLFRFKRLQSRLFSIFLSLFFAVGFFSFLLLNHLYERSARNQIQAKLTVSAGVLDKIIAMRLENHGQAASILSKDYAFQQAFSTDDLETASSAMESLRQRIKADLMMLLSTEDEHKVLVDTRKSASRLESQSKTLKRLIIVSEATIKKARGFYKTECMGEVTVKGRSKPTRVFALLGRSPQANSETHGGE